MRRRSRFSGLASRLPFGGWAIILVASICCVAVSAPCVLGDQFSTAPADGLRQHTPRAFALVGATVVVAPGRVLEKATIVVRDGVIQSVGDSLTVPTDVRAYPMPGQWIYPGFVDAYGEIEFTPQHAHAPNAARQAALTGAATAAPASPDDEGTPYWNPLVRPERRTADHLRRDADRNENLRGQGFTLRLVAPSDGVIKGTSALVATSDEAPSRALVQADVAQHMRLTVRRDPQRAEFPNSPMGAVALVRQALYDADWHAEAWATFHAGRGVPRPEHNAALEALAQLRSTRRLVIADAPNERYFLRADRLAREFALNVVMRGSGREYRRLAAVRETGRPVILPLNFPKAPRVDTPEASRLVGLDELMHWDLAPENPARLERAGVRIALTTHGLSGAGDFLASLRQAVERGWPADAALRALTTTPAELFGIARDHGTLEPGKQANFVVTTGNLFDAATRVVETCVQGKRYDIRKPISFDPRGTWQVAIEGVSGPVELVVFGERDELKASLKWPATGTTPAAKQLELARVSMIESQLTAVFDATAVQTPGRARLMTTMIVTESAPGIAPRLVGHVVWPDARKANLTATRTATQPAVAPPSAPATGPAGEAPKHAEPEKKLVHLPASFDVNYPLGAWGVEPPAGPQPVVAARQILFTGATIWTCGPAGTLERASILIGEGKILAIGPELAAPEGATIVDCQGKHLTPGVIDCHSHIATDGGVNESSQSVTAEVRIGDFINADDINIYRQLAGGVTCSHILHGSANTIGGQCQIVKFRWGLLDEELKFAGAPPTIKFALGENVKQSNRGDRFTTRYPQTRMGVEQLVRDEFQAARDYARRRRLWEETHQGTPPRRDLELDAIVEVLDGKRWIHCHSYRQDEVLAFLRTLQAFDVTVGAMQHILEGYKVADEMARHNAMGSAFADWWAYKFEVIDAIPHAGALMHRAGVVVSFNSDDAELARHLNQEAAKAIKYGGLTPDDALRFVTLNPARQMRIDAHVGSLEVGKHADLVVWSGPPLSNYARCEQTWIDGRRYFDRGEDQLRRQRDRSRRDTLIQKILASGAPMEETRVPEEEQWPTEDEACHARHE